MSERGYNRIWDCGNKKWLWSDDPPTKDGWAF